MIPVLSVIRYSTGSTATVAQKDSIGTPPRRPVSAALLVASMMNFKTNASAQRILFKLVKPPVSNATFQSILISLTSPVRVAPKISCTTSTRRAAPAALPKNLFSTKPPALLVLTTSISISASRSVRVAQEEEITMRTKNTANALLLRPSSTERLVSLAISQNTLTLKQINA